MSYDFFVLFVVTNFVLNLTPGPAVMMVIGHAMVNGPRRAQASALGVLSGNVFYCLLSAFGLGAVLVASREFLLAIQYLGAAYLVYLALKTWMSPNQLLGPKPDADQDLSNRLFKQAFLAQLSNPKSILFFGAFVPQFVDPAYPAIPQIIAYGLLAVALEYPVLAIYACLGGQALRFANQPRIQIAFKVASGLMLIGAAIGVAFMRNG